MKARPLPSGARLPLLVEPETPEESDFTSLCGWAGSERSWIDAQLLERGALLLRSFKVTTPRHFARLCGELGGSLMNYAGGDSPRRAVQDKVYTSTEFPPHLEIYLHNELSYAGSWPSRGRRVMR